MKSVNRKAYLSRTPNGSYRVRLQDESGDMRSRNFKRKMDAELFARAIKKGELLDDWFGTKTYDPGGIKTFQELAHAWMEHGEKVREISRSCLGNYRAHLKHHILPVLGKKPISQLKLTDIEKLAMGLKKKKPMTKAYSAVRKNVIIDDDREFLSPDYRQEILIVCCMVTKWALEREYLPSNPFAKFKLPEKPEQPYDYWRLEDEDQFMDWIESGGFYYKETAKPFSRMNGTNETFMKKLKMRNSEELRDIVLFALRSAMRLGEIGALTNRDVNLEKNWIRVRASFSRKENKLKNTTKNKKFRFIELNEDMRDILERRRDIDLDTPIFNIHMNSIKFFSRTCRLAGVREIHFHALRHTCLTNLANGYGMDAPLPIVQVQRIAGHSEIKTTMRYVHSAGIERTNSIQWSTNKRRANNLNALNGGSILHE